MKESELITSKLYLNIKILGDEKVSKEQVKFYLLHRSRLPLEEMINFKDKLKECSDVITEVVEELSGHTEYQEVFDAVYFYLEVLGKTKGAFSQWKSKGFFKNELGTDRQQKITLQEIEDFLNHSSTSRSYRKLWENR